MAHGLINLWSNAACYRAYWGCTNSWYHWCRGEFMVNPLVFNNSRNLRTIIVMMVLVHLLLELLYMLIRQNFSRTIATHLFILTLFTLLTLVIIVPSSSTTSHRRSLRSISTAISSSCREKHWRLHMIIRWIVAGRWNQCLVPIEAFQLEVRLEEILVHLVIKLSFHFLSELLVNHWILRIQFWQNDEFKTS